MAECPKHYQLSCGVTKDGNPLEVEHICEELFDDDPRLYQALEYLCRCKRKGQFESDLQKAIYYIQKALDREGSEYNRSIVKYNDFPLYIINGDNASCLLFCNLCVSFNSTNDKCKVCHDGNMFSMRCF